MSSLKEVKSRINSVKSTRKITSAMKMVASVKLHKVETMAENMLPYQFKLDEMLGKFLTSENSITSPYIEKRPVKKLALILFSSNTSFCGAFNSNVTKSFLKEIANYSKLGKENIIIYPIGKKIEYEVKKLGYEPAFDSTFSSEFFQNLMDKPNAENAILFSKFLQEKFLKKEIDKIRVVFHHFKSTNNHRLISKDFLPINIYEFKDFKSKNDSKSNIDYIIEPSNIVMLERLVDMVLTQKFVTYMVDSSASEHSARIMSMQIATDNADELIDDLGILYNKTRQNIITAELLDIAGASNL